jgi:murein L,D-transpeptidase YcbB/YkuD
MTFYSCIHDTEQKEKVLITNPDRINENVNELIKKQLGNTDPSKNIIIANDTLLATKQVEELYTKNIFTLLWTNKGKQTKQCDTLISILKNADEYGLIANDYHIININNFLKTEYDSIAKSMDAIKLQKVDLLLTDAFFAFIIDVSKGRLNVDSLTREWHPDKLDTNLVDVLNVSIKNNSIRKTISSFEPQSKQYQNLKLALKNFKNEFTNRDWKGLESRESDSTTFNERLKQRLYASHDYFYEYSGSDSIKLVKAIKNFQCKHNLNEDGKIGKLTFQALQLSKQDHIRQIELNMERWRLYNVPSGPQYVWVNIPKYEMRLTEDDTLVMKSKIIVGQPTKQTPLLKSTIRYFIIYPYWTVPLSIATKEILPILKRDTSYLRKKNFDVLDRNNNIVDTKTIDWKKYNKNYFPWKLRQRIGEDNSLGVLKFNFENKYGVYMHDTDNHRLFGKEMRGLSHGCVRLEKFMDFAQFLIRDDSIHYPLDSLKIDLLNEVQKYVYVKHPIPIYINYFTTEVDANGELFFFIDVYGRDKKMLKALYK